MMPNSFYFDYYQKLNCLQNMMDNLNFVDKLALSCRREPSIKAFWGFKTLSLCLTLEMNNSIIKNDMNAKAVFSKDP